MRNQFINPFDGVAWDWPVNHDTDDAFGRVRSITATANTGGGGLVRQQGDDSPLKISLSGTILHRVQLRQMWAYFALCSTQTIYFRDFDGQKYEVTITGFTPTRMRVVRNQSDPTMRTHIYKYKIDMDVIALLAGDMFDQGIVQ